MCIQPCSLPSAAEAGHMLAVRQMCVNSPQGCATADAHAALMACLMQGDYSAWCTACIGEATCQQWASPQPLGTHQMIPNEEDKSNATLRTRHGAEAVVALGTGSKWCYPLAVVCEQPVPICGCCVALCAFVCLVLTVCNTCMMEVRLKPGLLKGPLLGAAAAVWGLAILTFDAVHCIAASRLSA